MLGKKSEAEACL
jgi:HlyD family secretion protein